MYTTVICTKYVHEEDCLHTQRVKPARTSSRQRSNATQPLQPHNVDPQSCAYSPKAQRPQWSKSRNTHNTFPFHCAYGRQPESNNGCSGTTATPCSTLSTPSPTALSRHHITPPHRATASYDRTTSPLCTSASHDHVT